MSIDTSKPTAAKRLVDDRTSVHHVSRADIATAADHQRSVDIKDHGPDRRQPLQLRDDVGFIGSSTAKHRSKTRFNPTALISHRSTSVRQGKYGLTRRSSRRRCRHDQATGPRWAIVAAEAAGDKSPSAAHPLSAASTLVHHVRVVSQQCLVGWLRQIDGPDQPSDALTADSNPASTGQSPQAPPSAGVTSISRSRCNPNRDWMPSIQRRHGMLRASQDQAALIARSISADAITNPLAVTRNRNGIVELGKIHIACFEIVRDGRQTSCDHFSMDEPGFQERHAESLRNAR